MCASTYILHPSPLPFRGGGGMSDFLPDTQLQKNWNISRYIFENHKSYRDLAVAATLLTLIILRATALCVADKIR